MYLAEDRILCFEIVAKRKQAWTLKYVKSAKASTDVPDTVPEFISQRRRWMNGSFFAAVHGTTHYYRIVSFHREWIVLKLMLMCCHCLQWTSGQGFFRKIWLSFLFFYNFIQVSLYSLQAFQRIGDSSFVYVSQLIFQFIGLSSFYLAFFFICETSISESGNDPFGGKGADVISVANSLCKFTVSAWSKYCAHVSIRDRHRDAWSDHRMCSWKQTSGIEVVVYRRYDCLCGALRKYVKVLSSLLGYKLTFFVIISRPVLYSLDNLPFRTSYPGRVEEYQGATPTEWFPSRYRLE